MQSWLVDGGLWRGDATGESRPLHHAVFAKRLYLFVRVACGAQHLVGVLTLARSRQRTAPLKILRLATMALVRGDHARGAFYRRLAARTDKPTAMTATARKLALLVYRMLKDHMPYQHTSAAEYDTRQRTRILRDLRKRAASLGFELVEASGLVV